MSNMPVGSDERFYSSADYSDTVLSGAVAKASVFFDGWRKQLDGFGTRNLRVLDIGAGTCSLSALLSAHQAVDTVVATDISITRMQRYAPKSCQIAGGDMTKIEFRKLDFNNNFPFDSGEFGLVVADAALHHSRSIWTTLFEVNRVLAPNGVFAAQREAFLAPITGWMAMKRILVSPEFTAGVSENAYLKSQYDYYLKAAGFAPTFISHIPELRFKWASALNGLAFGRYLIWAPKVSPPLYLRG